MIDRKKTQYVILYVNHNMNTTSIVQWDPKVSVLLWLERRCPAQSEKHTKSNTSMCFGGIFPGCRSGSKQRYFKFVISASHCQQLGLYSKCYTVCDFTLHQSHSKCPEVKTAKPLLSVLRTGKPNWRGVQPFRQMTKVLNNCNCSLFFTLQLLSLSFTSHSIAIRT